jgi:hypothetical protein
MLLRITFAVALAHSLYACGPVSEMTPRQQMSIIPVDAIDAAGANNTKRELAYLSTELSVGQTSKLMAGDQLMAQIDLKLEGSDAGFEQEPYFLIQNEKGQVLVSYSDTKSTATGKRVTISRGLSEMEIPVKSEDTSLSISLVNKKSENFTMTVYGVKLYALRQGKQLDISLPPLTDWSKPPSIGVKKDQDNGYILGFKQILAQPSPPSASVIVPAASAIVPARSVEEARPSNQDPTQPSAPLNDSVSGDPLCGEEMDSCYENLAALAAGRARLTDGSKIILVPAASGFKVWKDASSDKIIKASGFYSKNGDWQKRLMKSGWGYDGDFLGYKGLAGRACPEMIYRADYSMITDSKSENCLYYDTGTPKVRLGGEPSKVKNIGIEKIDWMWIWSDIWGDQCTFRCRTPLYFQGNIKTCNVKGMRLPTIYEAEVDLDYAPFQKKYGLPRRKSYVDQWLTQGGATYPLPGKGVPAVPGGLTYTASGVWQPFFASQYFVYDDKRHPEKSAFNTPQNVRCVLPP